MSNAGNEEISESEIKNILNALNSVKSAEELAEIVEIPGKPDVGVKIAEDILEYRLKKGFFTNLKQIREIPNVGPKRFSYILDSLRAYQKPVEIKIGQIPVIEFEQDASVSILNYEIPSPSSYEGQNYIEINLEKEINSKYTAEQIESVFNQYPVDSVFNEKANKGLLIGEYINLNKEYIQDYLGKATKEDLEKEYYAALDLENLFKGYAVEFDEDMIQFPGTFTFESDERDSVPVGWADVSQTSQTDGKIGFIKIVDSWQGHRKVLLLHGASGTADGQAEHIIDEGKGKSEGAFEFWIGSSNNYFSRCYVYNETNKIAIYLSFYQGKLQHRLKNNTFVPIPNTTMLNNKFYHVKISFNCDQDSYDVSFNNNLVQRDIPFRIGSKKMKKIRITCDGAGSASGRNLYIDAIGFSWDPNYKIGQNWKEGIVSSELITEALKLDPTVVEMLENIEIRDDSGKVIGYDLRAKYLVFKFLIKMAYEVYNKFPIFSRSLGGRSKLKWMKELDLRPRLYFIETYKLTNFPGDYGPGRLIKTFSLLPGEETEISIKTWKKSITSIKESSSVLDSYTEEKADEFERNIQNESSQTSRIEQSDTFSINASLKSTWGGSADMGFAQAKSETSAEVGTKYEKSMKSSREAFAKNVMNTTEKHAQKSSAKREINIETSYERTEEEGEEIAVVRKIENLNVSRTLNFTFRQMNQQHHSILHLTDLKLAFFNGYPGSMKEYELDEINDLVKEYIVNPRDFESGTDDYNNAVEKYGQIIDILTILILEEYGEGKLLDYQGHPKTLVKEIVIPEGAQSDDDMLYKYLRVVNPEEENAISEYVIREETEVHPKDIRYINGIIIGAKIISMKTDGVIVEALLGKANALDRYALDSRREKIREDVCKNDLKQAEINKIDIGIEIIKKMIEGGQFDKAVEAYKEIFGLRESLKSIIEVLGTQTLDLEKKISNI